MRHVTINDLARRLNLSASTVSRALRDHPDISEQTKERVRAIAAKTNYQPNLIAQSLQTRRSNNIGVIVPEIRNSFFSTVISGIEDLAYESGYTIMVCQSDDTFERETINTRALAANRVAGMLVSVSQETADFTHLKQVLAQGVPIVLFDRVVDQINAPKVVVDDFNGAFQAVTHLIETGRKRIAHLTSAGSLYVAEKRREGYEAALHAHGFAVRPEYIIEGGCHEEDGREGARRLLTLEKPPDGIFAINDPVALGALLYLQDNQVMVPEQVGLVGFSDNPNAVLVRPALTTINQPAYDIGKTAASLLLDILESGTLEHDKTITLETRLVVRGST
ncbi:MAG: LacI family transcriptional regulator [Desulfofustis sp.]|nr:LacI family transcriptional regulator [Desulfofustis sp.]MBT8354430.1 LacI family transcriptional regulator [Desulfofustis sp.]NNF45299.1 LacI family DNA-binding transcriptional regulator [Desulfofustis sp.]NNK57474.1 LacI family DNA-binding transcriptional regulator [Desulfofustis sp.]